MQVRFRVRDLPGLDQRISCVPVAVTVRLPCVVAYTLSLICNGCADVQRSPRNRQSLQFSMALDLLAALVESAGETPVVIVRRCKLLAEGGQVRFAILLATAFLSGIVSPITKSQERSPTQRPKSAKVNSKTAKLNTFNSEEWGFSFMYPDTYAFKESNAPVEPNAIWYPGRSIDGHPGEVQLVTVEIPNELFPGTDLRLAIFSLSANRHITREECWASVAGNERAVSKVDLDGVEFRWSEGADALSAAGFRDYAGFANGTCYEIETAAVTRNGPPQGTSRVDQADLDRRMDEMLSSFKMHSVNAPQNLPSILSFTVEALSPPSPPASYRFRWDVTGATDRQVTIDVNCFTDVSMIEVADLENGGTAVPCGELRDVSPSSGSVGLSFANHTGVVLHPEVRLLAVGKVPVSKTVEISLQTMAVIRGTTYLGGDMRSGEYVQLYPGQRYVIYGASFLSSETVWIGETSVPAVSTDGRHLEFPLPSTMSGGSVAFYVEDTRGKSNVLTARAVRSQPRISFYIPADAPPAQSRNMRNIPVSQGQRMRLVGVGFTLHNKVWIGSTSIDSEADDRYPQFQLYFTIPNSLEAGSYALSVTNDLGKSNEITLTLSSR